MKKQYGIRMTGATAEAVENFAEVHKMSPTAAAEFFVKLGIESLSKDERIDARIEKLEERLKLVYRSLASSMINLQTNNANPQKAEEMAAVATSKIFAE